MPEDHTPEDSAARLEREYEKWASTGQYGPNPYEVAGVAEVEEADVEEVERQEAAAPAIGQGAMDLAVRPAGRRKLSRRTIETGQRGVADNRRILEELRRARQESEKPRRRGPRR